MITVSSVEFQRNFGRYQDVALTEPVAVTRNGRDRLVLLSVDEYHRLKQRDRQVLRLEDFTTPVGRQGHRPHHASVAGAVFHRLLDGASTA